MKIPYTARFARFWVVLVSALSLAGAAHAQKLAVTYNQPSTGIGGELPYHHTYQFTVKAPLSLPVGSSFPLTSPLVVVPQTMPVPGISAETAASWVKLSSDALTFSTAGEVHTVQVTIDIPETALNGSVPSGMYTYIVYANGWPLGVNNPGHRIEASVEAPDANIGEPPEVDIVSPVSGPLTFGPTAFPAEVPFNFIATVEEGSPVITSVTTILSSDAGPAVLQTENTGLETRLVTGTGTFTVTGPGVYALTTTAVNAAGEDLDREDYTVVVQGVPPTVVIDSPVAGTTYTYRVGEEPVNVSFTFTARSTSGGIRTLTAKVDGVEVPFSPQGLHTLTATGEIHLPYTTAGTHTIEVATTDDFGADADAGHFIVNVVAPEPVITITTPSEGDEFIIPIGSTTIAVPYAFTTQVGNGFVIDTASAMLGVSPLNPTLMGLPSPLVTGNGTLQLAPGTYEITARGGSHGYIVTDRVSFTVKAEATPPTVVINSPANGHSEEILPGGTVSIPFTFTGSSTTPGAVITQLTATLDGVPVPFTSTTLNTAVAVGNATLTFNAAGSHSLYVTATDAHGTAQATGAFTVTAAEPRSISGTVFFDVNANGLMDASDYGLAGVTVKLLNGTGGTVATLTSSATGAYSFPGLFPGNFSVKTTAGTGFTATTPTTRPVTMARENVTAPAIGYTLDLCAISGLTANGKSHGFWKNNVAKAIQGKSAQIPAAAINAYTNSIAAFALSPFDGLTKQQAVTIMNTSGTPAQNLALQLVASEYNYQNKAYLGGNGVLTYAFVYWGEWILANAGSLPAATVNHAKDWFDRYNNTYGGVMGGSGDCGGSTPPPPPPSGGDDGDCDRDRDRHHDDDDDHDRHGDKGKGRGRG